MKRIQLINHKGKEILYLDFSNCTTDEVFLIIEMAKKIIRVQTHNSVLTLTNVTGTKYNREVIRVLKEFVNNNTPFVKARAVIGVHGLKRIVYDAVIKFTDINLQAFDDVEKAKDWLVEQ